MEAVGPSTCAASFAIMDLEELEAGARDRMERTLYDYYAGGAEAERTLRGNVAAWDHWRLKPFVLRDVSSVRTATTVLGTPVAAPVLVAPTACHAFADPEGEVATARGTAAAASLMIISTLANVALEDLVTAVPDVPRWFQLYVFDDRGLAGDLVDRAVAAGCSALVLTVDAPVLGRRLRDERNRYQLPEGLELANLRRSFPDAEGSGLAAMFTAHDRRLTFDDLGWLRERSGLPLVVKGLHRGDDAARCVASGADAVVVSNHGGRQVDSAVATADVLAEVVEHVDDEGEVYVDGGIRSAGDVLKALALGARAVLLGRPILWALACGGDEGVRELLDAMRVDLERTMIMCGVTDVADVPADLVTPAPGQTPSIT